MKNHKSQTINYKQITNSKLKKSILIFALLALFVICNLYIVISQSYALDLEKIKASYLNADYKAAVKEGEKTLASLGNQQGSDELYYILGLSYLKDGNYLRASDIFEIILNELKSAKYRDQAMVGLGDTFLLRGDLIKAESIYKELLEKNSETKLKAQLYARLIYISGKNQDTQKEKEYRDLLRQEFPLSSESVSIKEPPMDKDVSVASIDTASIIKDATSTAKDDISAAAGAMSAAMYSVQVGFFSNNINAKNLSEKLIQEGYPAFIEEVSEEGKSGYRVKVGKFAGRPEALTLEEKLAREGYPAKICQ